MENSGKVKLQQEIDIIINEYLFNVSSLRNHNYFNSREYVDNQKQYYENTGFSLLTAENENAYVVKEEMFLEGCTRVYLINPIIKLLLDKHNIENEWQYGTTFSNYNISNREYELGSFLEFIVILDEDRCGIRYTKSSYSSSEKEVLQ